MVETALAVRSGDPAFDVWDMGLVLVVIHVLGVLVMCVLQRENLIRAMITGWKRRHF